ncbi:MAG TPA: hypothetical protein VJY15_03050 [Candidatus Acidoferrum sp.]|nr:hypothetical protein [Candidatus Acidoferrum sp.]
MNPKAYACILAFICMALGFLTGCNNSSSASQGVSITATSGTPQNTTVGTAFLVPLRATVTANGGPASGVAVTFTAPATGASGTFANGTATETDMTNANGVATSSVFKANSTLGGPYQVSASVPLAPVPASFSLTNTATGPFADTITATAGTPQSVPTGTLFAVLQATVTSPGGAPASGLAVTFTAPATGASGTFASNSTATEIDTTNASGVATSSVFTANATAGGPYMVTASTPLAPVPAGFSLTNTAVAASNNYTFYLSGVGHIYKQGSEVDGTFYALAGAVAIAADGTIVGGEQDYNDGGFASSPQPSGDKITGGALTVSATTGQGTLTLITNNVNLGVNGTETFSVQFVNTQHALIMQFDGSATSSGSMDLQTLTSPPSLSSGGYAFILSGMDVGYAPLAYGGVFTIPSSGTTLQNGIYDVTEYELPAGRGNALSGTFTEPDSFGRGTIASSLLNSFGNPSGDTLNYYVVGSEAIRIIDVDTSDASAVGSAFGQGTNATAASNASLGRSVFGLAGSPLVAGLATLGQFSTSNTLSSPANWSGITDNNDLNDTAASTGALFSGTYSIASNGYGSLDITIGDVGYFLSELGIYMTDPNLNLNDPNKTTGGGGALVLAMNNSRYLAGVTGVLIPQTDTATANFTGNYAVGAQEFNSFNPSIYCHGPVRGFCEFDLVGQGSVASGVLSGTAQISDPSFTLTTNATDSVLFSGTPLADTNNPGRYTLLPGYGTTNPLELTFDYDVPPRALAMVIYQASGGQLFWLEDDPNGALLGPLEQQGSLTGIPGAITPAAKTQMKQ